MQLRISQLEPEAVQDEGKQKRVHDDGVETFAQDMLDARLTAIESKQMEVMHVLTEGSARSHDSAAEENILRQH